MAANQDRDDIMEVDHGEIESDGDEDPGWVESALPNSDAEQDVSPPSNSRSGTVGLGSCKL